MYKINKFLLCLAFLFLCNMPVYAADEDIIVGGVSNEVSQEVDVSDVNVLQTDSSAFRSVRSITIEGQPIAVYTVPNPYSTEVVAMLGDVYQGTISDANLKYLSGFVDASDDYLIYRSGQYTYVVITGNDFQKSGSTVSGSGLVSTLTTNGSYNEVEYTLNQSERSFSVNTSNSAYVYSNLDGYSDCLKEVRYETLTCHAVFMLFIFNVVRDLFRSVFS